jgi:hypothetical protein
VAQVSPLRPGFHFARRDFVQLVVAMNKSWSELENAFIHVARRIAEMCVPIDFDKLTVTGANEATEANEPT